MMIKEEGIELFPLFIDYGQKASKPEWHACQTVHKNLNLPTPVKVDISGFGSLILSGLTSAEKSVKEEAFTPGRNLLFILVGSAYAFQVGANAVSIGLLNEKYSLFPDQAMAFINSAEAAIKLALGKTIKIVVPLSEFSKADVISIAKTYGVTGTYSCHAGTEVFCGECISCLELQGAIRPKKEDE
jgi:7-cyano-7-deazaguanine synthase